MSVDDSDLSKLLGSAMFVFVGTIVGSSSKLLERAVVGRLLSESAYGEFTVALSVFMMAGTMGIAGFGQGVPRYMARFDDDRDIRGTIFTGLLVTTGLSLLVALALLSSWNFTSSLFEASDSNRLFQLFVLAVPLYVAFRIGIGGIRGHENTSYKILSQNLAYPILRVGIIAVFLGLGYSVFVTGIGYILALLVATSLVYYLLNQLLPLRGDYTLHTRDMVMFSAPLVVSTIMSRLLTYTDTIMLGFFRSSREVGIYNAAYPLAVSMTLVLAAFGYLYLPLASRLDSDEEGSVGRVYEVTTKWLFLLVFPIFLTMVAFPTEIISVVFGSRYTAGGTVLSILAVGFFTNAAVGRNRETLSALGATSYILVANTIAYAVNFGLNIALIPRYGIRGAAIASATSYIGLNVMVFLVLRAKFGITPFTSKSIRMFVGLPIALGPLALLARWYAPAHILSIAAFGIGIGLAALVVVGLLGGYEAEDAVLFDYVEEKIGREIPGVRMFVPHSSGEVESTFIEEK